MKFREKEFILSAAKNIAYAAACGNYNFSVTHKNGALTEEEVIEVAASIISATKQEPCITKLPRSLDGRSYYKISAI